MYNHCNEPGYHRVESEHSDNAIQICFEMWGKSLLYLCITKVA